MKDNQVTNFFTKIKFLPIFLFLFLVFKKISYAVDTPTNRNIFGRIQAPAGVEQYNSTQEIGIIVFASNLLRASTVIAGIWVTINFIMAGWTYITSNGDAGAHAKVANKLTMSVIGLMLIVGSYTIAALIGLIIFGDVSYILNPKFEGVGMPTYLPIMPTAPPPR